MLLGTLFRKSEEQSPDGLIDFKAGNIPIAKAAALVGMDVETFSRHCASPASLGEIMPIRIGDTTDAADLYTYLFRREHSGKIPPGRDTFTLEEVAAIVDVPHEIIVQRTCSLEPTIGSQWNGSERIISAGQVEMLLEGEDKPERRLRLPGYVPKEVREWRKALRLQDETEIKTRTQSRSDAVARATNEFNLLLAQFEPEAVAEALAVLNRSKSD